MLEAEQDAQAYVSWIADGGADCQALVSHDVRDHVSGGTGPGVWDPVWGWFEESFDDRRAELHGCGTLDDGRIAVWVTLHGKHIGSGLPWLGDRPASGAQIAW